MVNPNLQAIKGLTDQQMNMETINSNFLSIMSMVIGLNYRLNVQENLLRKILAKLEGNGSDGDEAGDDKTEKSEDDQQQDGIEDDNAVDGLNVMDHLISSMVTATPMEIPDLTSEVDDKEISCFECKQVFVRGTGEFTRHLRETSCRPYACDHCGKLFKKKSNMKTHRLTHSLESAVCAECGATFKCEQYLKNHHKRVHQTATVKEEDTSSNDTDQLAEPKAKRMKISHISDIDSSSMSSSTASSGFAEFPSTVNSTFTAFTNATFASSTVPRADFDDTYALLMSTELGKAQKPQE